MYGLTYAGIVDALVAANSRGVDVALKTDKIESAGKTQAAMIAKLEQAGIPVDDVSMQSRLLHHKFVVIDDCNVCLFHPVAKRKHSEPSLEPSRSTGERDPA